MIQNKKLWGELEPTNENINVPDITQDIMKAMQKDCLSTYEILEKPIQEEEAKLELPPMDYNMIHAINLHKHIKHVTEMIRAVESRLETNVRPPPPIPERPYIPRKHKPNDLNFIPKTISSFSLGIGKEQPQLTDEIIRNVLVQCVATMFAHIGFEVTYQNTLDVMVDVLKEFMKKVCHLLVVAVEDENREGSMGFPDIVDRVLIQTGMGGVKGIHDYYENRLIAYQSVLEHRCRKLNAQYEKLVVPNAPTQIKSEFNPRIVQVKQEKEDVEEVYNADMQIATADGKIGYVSNSSTYFELLDGFEQEVQNNTISPGVVSIAESDLSSTQSVSPFGKKKHMN